MVHKTFLLLSTILGNFAFGFSSYSNLFLNYNRPINSLRLQRRNLFSHHSTTSGTKVTSVINGQSSSCSSSSSLYILSRLRGGEATAAESNCPMRTLANNLISIWACEGFVLMLVNSVRRLVPKALEPFKASAESVAPLTSFQLGAYVATCLFFAYVEGYKGFQRKFAPLVVARSFTINLTKIHHIILGPLYSMGLIHATKRRKIVSWSLTFGIVAIVAAVKQLPYPWKNIIDAGVVVGLSWGAAAIQIGFLKAFFMKKFPDVNPELP